MSLILPQRRLWLPGKHSGRRPRGFIFTPGRKCDGTDTGSCCPTAPPPDPNCEVCAMTPKPPAMTIDLGDGGWTNNTGNACESPEACEDIAGCFILYFDFGCFYNSGRNVWCGTEEEPTNWLEINLFIGDGPPYGYVGDPGWYWVAYIILSQEGSSNQNIARYMAGPFANPDCFGPFESGSLAMTKYFDGPGFGDTDPSTLCVTGGMPETISIRKTTGADEVECQNPPPPPPPPECGCDQGVVAPAYEVTPGVGTSNFGGDWDKTFCFNMYGLACVRFIRCNRVSIGTYEAKSLFLEFLPADATNGSRVRVTLSYWLNSVEEEGGVFEQDYGDIETPCLTLEDDLPWKENIGLNVDFSGGTVHIKALEEQCDDDIGGSWSSDNCPGFYEAGCTDAAPHDRLLTLPTVTGCFTAQAVTVTNDVNPDEPYIGNFSGGTAYLFFSAGQIRVRVETADLTVIEWISTQVGTYDCLDEYTVPWSSDVGTCGTGNGTTVTVGAVP